jgi:hypothetical protein
MWATSSLSSLRLPRRAIRPAVLAATGAAVAMPTGMSAATHATSPYLAACVNKTFTAFNWRIQPKTCVMAATSDPSFAFASNLAGLRWSAWGGARAVATGYERGFHLPLAHIPARVVLSQPVHPLGDLSVYVYKRFRVTTSHGSNSGTIRSP